MIQQEKGKKTRKRRAPFVIFPILVILIAVGVGFFAYGRKGESARPEAEEPPPSLVHIEVAEGGKTVRDSIVQNMSIDAVNRVQMIPRVSGRLERVHVKQGDRVKAGQPVATLEHEQQDALISATEAQVASARSDSERAKAEMMNAKTNLDRYERLVKEGFSTQQQYDTTETAYVSARASYNAALAKERQTASELGRVKSTRQDYIINSPLDGTVLNDYSLSPGAMISPTLPIADIADLRRLKASLRVPENKIFVVKPGMEVFLRFDALPDEEFRGEVTRIDPYVDPATRSSAVEIELDNEATGNRLRPGMFGQASIVEREFSDSLLIPDSALNSGSDGYYAFIEEDGLAKRRDVQTGIRQGNFLQITKGIEPGDRVIVFGGSHLNDGDRVEAQ
ncbi:MAG: efflux RND transporter periplasmic adaptor subunit [Synergistaceae bacterium]|jgi:RND family efflux transporter MFP subunit|nr:efflux RND transporter periplasmic adaptor subunit [Synergistaceae bacterium]